MDAKKMVLRRMQKKKWDFQLTCKFYIMEYSTGQVVKDHVLICCYAITFRWTLAKALLGTPSAPWHNPTHSMGLQFCRKQKGETEKRNLCHVLDSKIWSLLASRNCHYPNCTVQDMK